MSVALQFKLTQTGQAAVWNANNTGTSLNLTHIQFGSGNRAPSGTEMALLSPQQAVAIAAGFSVSSTQIRMSAIFSGNQNYVVREVGVWAGDPAVGGSKLVGYWSQAAGDLAMKSPGVDFIFSHDMTLDAAVPAGSLTILADNAQSAMLAMIAAHEAAADPHPQYTTNAEVNALIEARVGDYVTATNAGNAYTVALDPVVTAYTNKTAFAFKASAANTGAVTLNAGGGAKALVREDGTALQANDIASGAVVTVVFDTATDSFRSTEIVASQIAAAIQAQTYTAFSAAGAAPTFTLAPSPAITAYAAGQRFRVKFGAAGNGADTLNVSGLGAKNLKQYDATGAKVAPVIAANQLVDVEYDGAEFVLLDPLPAGLATAGTVFYTASATLSTSDIGKTVLLNFAAAGGTVSLPSLASVSAGKVLILFNWGAQAIGIAAQAGQVINNNSGNGQSFTLPASSTLILVAESGTSWDVVGGSAQLSTSPLFGSSKVTNGYQKLPNGLILQWGEYTASMAHTTNYSPNFPIAFPTACLQVLSSPGNTVSTGVTPVYLEFVSMTTTGWTFQYGSVNGGTYTTTCRWFAIGY